MDLLKTKVAVPTATEVYYVDASLEHPSKKSKSLFSFMPMSHTIALALNAKIKHRLKHGPECHIPDIGIVMTEA